MTDENAKFARMVEGLKLKEELEFYRVHKRGAEYSAGVILACKRIALHVATRWVEEGLTLEETAELLVEAAMLPTWTKHNELGPKKLDHGVHYRMIVNFPGNEILHHFASGGS